jgi:hypothetical protein
VSALDEIVELEAEARRLATILEEIAKRITVYEQAMEPAAVKIRRLQRYLDQLEENERTLRYAPVISLKEYAAIRQEYRECCEALSGAARTSADIERTLRVQRLEQIRVKGNLEHIQGLRAKYGRLYPFPQRTQRSRAEESGRE